MRKSSSRKVKPVSQLLTPKQHQDLVIRPRLCLELLRQGLATKEHLLALIGFFNYGGALAYLNEREALMDDIFRVQQMLADLAIGNEGPYLLADPAHPSFRIFNVLDDYLRIQRVHVLIKALQYADRATAGKEPSANVIKLEHLTKQNGDV